MVNQTPNRPHDSNRRVEETASAETRVLVVDDDESVVRLLVATLCEDGLDVVTAPNGQAALDRVEESRPDAIVLDLEMPVMDGIAFYRALEAKGLRIPVLVLSAYGAAHVRAELGADAALAKPFDPDELLNQMHELLGAGGQQADR